jgi:hypothetical protein
MRREEEIPFRTGKTPRERTLTRMRHASRCIDLRKNKCFTFEFHE